MKITAITKFKQGDLHHALKKLGWTQVELGKRTKISRDSLSKIINLRKKPSHSQLEIIQKAFADAGEYLDVAGIWPESFKGFAKSPIVEQTQNIDILLASPENHVLHDSIKPNLEEARRLIEEAVSELPGKQADAIRDTFLAEESIYAVAKKEGKATQVIASRRRSALQKLARIPKLRKKLEEAKECLSPA